MAVFACFGQLHELRLAASVAPHDFPSFGKAFFDVPKQSAVATRCLQNPQSENAGHEHSPENFFPAPFNRDR